MATIEIQPQKLIDWIGAGNKLPQFAAGYIQDYLEEHDIEADVSITADGTITFVTDATEADLRTALEDITPGDIDPGAAKDTAHAAIMAQLDAFADAVEAGTPPTALQTQQAVARLVRVIQYVAERLR